MTALVIDRVRTFPNNADLALGTRVKLSSGYPAAAGIGDDEIGVVEQLRLSTDGNVAIRLPNTGETIQVLAAGAIAQYAEIYAAASGKVSATPSGPRWGLALEAASGDGSLIEVMRLPGAGAAGGGAIVVEEVTFTEDGDTTYTGSVNVPAGATILDVQVQAVAVWDDGTSAVMKVGDAADDDGFYTGVNVKATDLTAGQVIGFAAQGGKGGVYITEGTGTHFLSTYSAAARVITGVVTTGAQNGSAGRTRMMVVYALPNVIAATGA